MTDSRIGHTWWQAEGRLERLEQMHEAELSASVIARRLGTTKNAVISMLHRLVGHEPRTSASTIFDRLDALHAEMDRVLHECARAS